MGRVTAFIVIGLLSLFVVVSFAAPPGQMDEVTLTIFVHLPIVVKAEMATAVPPTATPRPTDTAVPPTATPGSTPPANCTTCADDVYNCDDFATQAEAQACHDYCMNLVGCDIHELDGYDNDGLACEHLP
jgi:hypothetical protein